MKRQLIYTMIFLVVLFLLLISKNINIVFNFNF